MTIWTKQSESFRIDGEKSLEFDRFERISHRRQGECPVRSHLSRTRARMRSRGGAAARRKAQAYHGAAPSPPVIQLTGSIRRLVSTFDFSKSFSR